MPITLKKDFKKVELLLILWYFYDNLCQYHIQTDGQIYQKYSSEPHKRNAN